jgi:hypothetical protein
MESTKTNLELNLPKRKWMEEASEPETPSEWFATKFPEVISKYGCPFLEARQSTCDGFKKISPVSMNIDFMAGMLGGDPKLGHSVIYYENEMQFYYYEPFLKIYKPVSPEKLQNYYRAMLLRCLQELNRDVDKISLFVQFRDDKTAKAVVNRAKSILACSPDFFSATSPHQRIRGVELHERIARKFVDELLTTAPGNVLLLADAYTAFLNLVKQNSLEPLKRSEFKDMVVPFVQEKFSVCLRNDLKVDERSGVRGWKNVGIIQTPPA